MPRASRSILAVLMMLAGPAMAPDPAWPQHPPAHAEALITPSPGNAGLKPHDTAGAGNGAGSAAVEDAETERRPETSCAGDFSPPRKSGIAISPSSFELDSGEVVSLAGILTQPPFALRDLDALLKGRPVSIAPPNAPTDRWGRTQAHVFVHAGNSGEPDFWLQSRLVAEGHAIAYAPPGQQRCQSELLRLEADARREGRGLWASQTTLLRTADASETLIADEGTFRIVSGRVLRVSESRGRIYLNFGRQWRKDVTALIPPEVVRTWPGPAPDFKGLRGKTVSVRGWVRNRNGPLIVVESASMLIAPELKAAQPTIAPAGTQPSSESPGANPPLP